VTGGLYNNTDFCQPYTLPPCDHHTSGKYEPCGKSLPTPKCKTQCISNYPIPYAQDKWMAESVYLLPTQIAKIQS
jgi:cathepsin B